jgi:cytoskeletal protein CcmA (bactofilin family)
MSLLAKPVRSVPPVEPRSSASSEVNALLGPGSSFEGKLTFEGTVHINGSFVGEIRSKDTLVIGEGGKVQGEVVVGTLIVNGEFSGKARALQLIELRPPARFRGGLFTPALVVDRGAMLEGTSQMERLDQAAPDFRTDTKAD